MTDIHWLNPVSADFNTAADWSTGNVPGADDTAILDAGGSTAYTVTASTDEYVRFAELAHTATLVIASGTFAVESLGTNAGTIAVGSAETAAILQLRDGSALAGGGTILLGDNAGNAIHVATLRGNLVNIDNTIVGSGSVTVLRHLLMYNMAQGVIDADNKTPLNVNVASTTENAGLIETTGSGHLLIGGVDNTGTLEANGGVLTIKYEGGGTGSAFISAGTIDIKYGGFNQNVSFTGRSGKLELGQSQGYTGSITGFSLTGKTSLDLRDIGFVSSTEATFSGTAASGVLTVTDGTHTAHITLIGNYLSSTFVASSDGKGGTTVVDPTSGQAALAHHFIAAAAGLARLAGTAGLAHDAPQPRSAMLARPV